jgi:hypothetical protein
MYNWLGFAANGGSSQFINKDSILEIKRHKKELAQS